MITEFLEYLEPRLHRFYDRVQASPAMELPGSLVAIVTANVLIAGSMLLSAYNYEPIGSNPGDIVRAAGCYVIGFIVVDELFNVKRNTFPLSPPPPL